MKKPEFKKIEVRTFSCEEIETILANSPNFRDLKVARRDQWLSEMLNGHWECANGETICFDSAGRLINGQHRLSAALIYQTERNDPVWFLCVYGCSKEASMKTDLGWNRKLGDYLRSEGVARFGKCATIVMADCRYAMSHRSKSDFVPLSALISNNYTVQATDDPSSRRGKGNRMVPSLSMMMSRWKTNRGEVEYWAKVAEELMAKKICNAVALSALGYQLAKHNETDAKLFFSYLTNGDGMKGDDPILMLRERLKSVHNSQSKPDAISVCAWVVKTWVAWCEDRPVKVVTWRRFGPKAEGFPDHRISKNGKHEEELAVR